MKSYKDLTQRLDEILTKSTPAGKWIDDFVHSDNPKFAGKSAAKRKQMALAAYYSKQRKESAAVSQNSTAEVDMREAKEEHLVHVSDGSKYDEQPHEKDVEHVMAGVKQHGGEHAGGSDKGVFFKFPSKEHAQNFMHHVNKCPHKSCDAHLSEAIEYKGIGTDVVDKKKVLNPPIPLTQKKKEVKDFKEGYEHGPIDRDAKVAVGHKAAVLAGSGLDSGKHGTVVGSSKERTGDMWHIKTASGDIVKMHKHRVAKLKEEVEQIDEISKKTLGSYVKKAEKEEDKYQQNYSKLRAIRDKTHGRFSDDTPEMKHLDKKYVNRADGVYKAKQKLAKEDVELDEAKVYDPITKKMVPTKPIKVQAGGGATRNGVPVEGGPSKYKTIRQAYDAATAGQTVTPKQKLTKEEVVNLDELKKSTYQSYRDKAAKDVNRAYAIHQSPYKKTAKDDMRKLSNRVKGDERAERSLKEEQIDETKSITFHEPAKFHDAVDKELDHNKSNFNVKVMSRDLNHIKNNIDKSGKFHGHADHVEQAQKFAKRHKLAHTIGESVQIDEVSKSTLMRYIPKASRDVGSHTYAGKEAGEWASHYTRAGDWEAAEKHSKKSYADFKKANKRIAGIDRATKKLGTQKEEVEHIEEATVSSRKYDWGTMKTVNHGKSFSIPLHPEHHEPIAKLKHGESHSFKDETGRKWKATRDNDTVHFHGGSYGTQKTSVPHKSLTEAHHHDGIPGSQVKPKTMQVKTQSKVMKKEEVEESRGHKVLANFFKNREVAQRAFTGQNNPADKGTETPKKDAEEKKKMMGMKEGFLTKNVEDDMKNLDSLKYFKKYGKHKSQHRKMFGIRTTDIERVAEANMPTDEKWTGYMGKSLTHAHELHKQHAAADHPEEKADIKDKISKHNQRIIDAAKKLKREGY